MSARPKSLLIIVPCFNEQHTLQPAIDRILKSSPGHNLSRSILIVDDGSTDNSPTIAKQLADQHDQISLIKHDHNRGKGAAIRTALDHAINSSSADIILIHDADLEYHPRDHESVLRPFFDTDAPADVVIGSRFRGGSAHRVLYFWHEAANRFITLACDVAANLNLSDIECCTKAFRKDVIAAIAPKLREQRFGIEPELIIRTARARIDNPARPPRVFEVPVSYAGRTYAEGKKITWRDGLRALYVIARTAIS